MKSLNDILTALIGASWRTTLTGYAEAFVIAVGQYVLSGQVIPTDPAGFILWAVGILRIVQGHLAKDAAVSNAPNPGLAQKV